MLEIFFYLMIGHAFADFALQPMNIAKGKNRFASRPPNYDEEAHGPFDGRLWVMAMTAHALIHAGFVIVITGEPILGLWQFITHWLIDFERTSKRLTPWEDQTLHILVLATTAVLVSLP
ncbi:hypothetical protein LCGC14_1259780 [marine sediment metagenome]|uniref:DUF3307 domain-containing protein n=1 Tax=marine sediment metagenome TaxID=412755 RepID=A0A0F9L128_9ZZZZ